jgi:SLT domain-containing protein
MSDENGQRMHKVGVLWKPREGARSKGSGSVTIGELKQRFVILPNDRKRGERDPDYILMSAEAPEVDTYAREHRQPAAAQPQRPAPAPSPTPQPVQTRESGWEPTDDDVPF